MPRDWGLTDPDQVFLEAQAPGLEPGLPQARPPISGPQRWGRRARHMRGSEWTTSWLICPCWPSVWQAEPGLGDSRPISHLGQTILTLRKVL